MKKTAVITGATGGIGAALAKTLVRRGYRLVLPCRNADKCKELAEDIRLGNPTAELDFVLCDLSDLNSVASCGEKIIRRHPVIDLVIANAATVEPVFAASAQGIEKTFAVNHLAHFTLISWLLNNLFVHSRIVVVASSAARYGRGAFVDDINYRNHRYRMFRAYANSKLANLGCARHFSRLLASRQIACFSVHPGLLATNIWPRETFLQKLIVPVLKSHYFSSPETGAEAISELACSSMYNEAEGHFIVNRAAPPPVSLTAAFENRLLQRSLELCADYLPTTLRAGITPGIEEKNIA
jgi:NAD(P)-dependent dehydrogenase (short-subunit alcohol dehydrogenase family)